MKLEKLKKIIQNANPEICKQEYETCDCTQLTGSKYYCRPITLTDVLIAIDNDEGCYFVKGNELWFDDGFEKSYLIWNLHHDNLDWHAKNRPEVIKFLYDLLK